MEVNKPLKRRMKIKREEGAWRWVNFKYERLSTCCFVCGLLGHSERDCAVIYESPDKLIEKVKNTHEEREKPKLWSSLVDEWY